MQAFLTAYHAALRRLVRLLAVVAGAGIVAMMMTTCLDVVLRAFGSPLQGSYDIVGLLGVITITCSLPYTTAVKGHVAVEYFFHKLSHRSRIFVDTLVRLLLMVLFIVLVWQNVVYSLQLHAGGQVTPTLQVPVFWVPCVVAFSCAVTVLVVLYNLLHPGKVIIKP
jgi:TRAP-type C4-dicarboxylate transport system permease small subunit